MPHHLPAAASGCMYHHQAQVSIARAQSALPSGRVRRRAAVWAMSASAAGHRSGSSSSSLDPTCYPHGLFPLGHGQRMADLLRRLGSVRVVEMAASRFVIPKSVLYELDGAERRWDMVQGMPSVGCILYHRGLQAVLLVRQFRPPVYAACLAEAEAAGQPPLPLSAGFTLELCAGLVDKTKSLEQIVKEEVLEECGYDVPLEGIRFVASYVAASGTMGARQRMYAAEVDDSMLARPGGGLRADGEAIEVLALPVARLQELIEDDSLAKSAALPFAFVWVQRQLEHNGGRLFGS